MVFTTPTDTITRHKYSLSLFSFPMNCQKEGKKGEREGEEESVTPPARLSFLEIHSFSKYSWSPQQFSNNIFRSLKDLSFLARCIYIDRDEILFPHKFLFLHIRSTIPFLFTYSSVLFSAAMLKNSQSETLYPSFFSISQHYSKHHLIYPYIYAMLCINVSNILSFL